MQPKSDPQAAPLAPRATFQPFVARMLLTALFSVLLAVASSAQTSLNTLYTLSGMNGDGASPLGDLVMDGNGVLYGSTNPGGRQAQVYLLAPPAFSTGSWTKTVIVAGFEIFNPVILGKQGELYGTAYYCGCVFQLVPSGGSWTFNTIHAFQGAAQGDGKRPALGKLAMDAKGNLYGVTQTGGVGDSNYSGTIYELSPPATSGGAWTEQILYEFQNVRGGFYFPQMNVAIDTHGALYGSTRFSRNAIGNRAPGVIYRLSPPASAGAAWTMEVINGSIGGNSVTNPGTSQLTVAPGGTVFGASKLAGGVFSLKPPATKGGLWVLTTLLPLAGGPGSEVARDVHGNLFGTNGEAVYKLAKPATSGGAWTYHVLHTFLGGSEGSQPSGRPLVDASGKVFGTTLTGGTGTCQNYLPLLPGCGTVFQLQ